MDELKVGDRVQLVGYTTPNFGVVVSTRALTPYPYRVQLDDGRKFTFHESELARAVDFNDLRAMVQEVLCDT